MLAPVIATLQLVASVVLGATDVVLGATDALASIAGGQGPVAVLLVVVALGVAAAMLVAPPTLRVEPDPAAAVHRGQTVDRSRLLAQSDPDAPGRTRPRAPSRGIAAA